MTYGMRKYLEFLDVWRLYPVKTQFSIPVPIIEMSRTDNSLNHSAQII